MSTFTEDEDEILINVVAGYPVLYDTSNQNYRNGLMKENVWKTIGKNMNKSGEECKKRWRVIRDGYLRFKKKRKLVTGSAAPKLSKDKRHVMLSFLDSIPEHRSGGSNIPSSLNVETLADEEDSVDVLSSNEQDTSKDRETSDNEETTGPEITSERNTPSITKKKAAKEDPILRVLKERDEKRNILMEKILKKKDDDVEFFIRHIGSVLRNLTRVEKAQAKKHISAILSEYEITAAKNLSKRRSNSPELSPSHSNPSPSPNSPGPRDRDQFRPSSVSHVSSPSDPDWQPDLSNQPHEPPFDPAYLPGPSSAPHVPPSDPANLPGPSSAPHVPPSRLACQPRPSNAPHVPLAPVFQSGPNIAPNVTPPISTYQAWPNSAPHVPPSRPACQPRPSIAPHVPIGPVCQSGPNIAPNVTPPISTYQAWPNSAPHMQYQYMYPLPGSVHYMQNTGPSYSPISTVTQSPGPTDLSLNDGRDTNEEDLDYFNL